MDNVGKIFQQLKDNRLNEAAKVDKKEDEKIDLKGWTDKDIALVKKIINDFGSGEHPAVSAKSLPYFKKDFINTCVNAAVKSKKLTLPEMGGAKRLSSLLK